MLQLEIVNRTINQTLQRFKRHENFVENVRSAGCALVAILPERERCDFVRTSGLCSETAYLLDYIDFYYCSFRTDKIINVTLGLFVLAIVFFYYFWCLILVTNKYFCPALKTLAKTMMINEHIAGVTLLAFGNSAPDFFTSMAGIHSIRNPFSDTYSSSLFLNTFVVGVVIILRPFAVEPAFYLRDFAFLLFNAVYIDSCIKLNKGIITKTMAVGSLAIYFSYILVVITEYALMVRKRRKLELKFAVTGNEEDALDLKRIQNVSQFAGISKNDSVNYNQRIDDDNPNKNLLKQFIDAVKPIDFQKYHDSNHFQKVLIILRIPIYLLTVILIPYVNWEDKNYGWSKLLCCLQFMITPCFIAWSIPASRYSVAGIPIYILILLGTVIIAYIAFVQTRTDRNPSYYKYVSILSACTNCVVIYVIASETLVMLEVLGIILRESNAFIGVTLLAWGIGFGDIVVNVTLASQGFPRMAFAACFGAPVFNFFSGIGIYITYYAFTVDSDKSFKLTEGTMGENSFVFLLLGLFITLLYGLTTNFMMRRCCGIINIILYFIFLIFNCLNEYSVLHSYGTDHTLDTIPSEDDNA